MRNFEGRHASTQVYIDEVHLRCVEPARVARTPGVMDSHLTRSAMAVSLPYLASYKNLPVLFERIATAKVPDMFSQTFMAQTLGLKGSTDRPLIPLLRTLGILDASNKPTARYQLLRNRSKAKRELAKAIKVAYRPLFDADESANRKSGDDLKGLIAQVAGTDQDATNRIAYTFGALAKWADFTSAGEESEDEGGIDESKPNDPPPPPGFVSKLRSEFHYNIQVHLPSNGTEETYLNIFNALRRVFQ
jgi:hypothetical protein